MPAGIFGKKGRVIKKVKRELRAARKAVGAASRRVRTKPVGNAAYTRPLRQGVGAYPRHPLGGTRNGTPKEWFNANIPCHLALPRAIGSYSVVRTTQLLTISSRVSLLGPMMVEDTSSLERAAWLNSFVVHDRDATVAINDAALGGNAYKGVFSAMSDAAWDNVTLTPAAFTVQVMNPAAVTAAKGIARIGRLRFIPQLSGDARSWDNFASQAAAYNFPRLCSGGKLALRGVTVDAVPYDMSQLSHFAPARRSNGGLFTWSTGNATEFAGFAPILLIQDSAMTDAGGLDVLVTCEWRVRFDPSNPAQGTHVRYPVASDSTWEHAVRVMEAMGHGVEDIAEVTAEAGAAAYGAARGAAILAPLAA